MSKECRGGGFGESGKDVCIIGIEFVIIIVELSPDLSGFSALAGGALVAW
jgi:hypothetical protein